MPPPDDTTNGSENDTPEDGTPPEGKKHSSDFHGGKVIDLKIEDDLKKSFLTYAMSVIVSRALPDVRDGLKPSQRRILVTMNDMNLGPRSKFRKCAAIVGDCMGKYHPHGDSSIYSTLARMGQDWNTRYLLIQGQGNFGSVNPDPPAAMRYTEARMQGATTEMLEDLEKDTVDFKKTFDEFNDEPTVLPGKLPNLLVNGSQGIAVGMTTNIAPHNLGEVSDALIHLIENPEANIPDLLKFIKGPDFPTGASIRGRKGILDSFRHGRGQVIMRAKVEFEEERDREQIVITELPYQVTIQRLLEKMVEHAKSGRIVGISDITDHTSKEGIRIVVEVKRGQNREVVLNQLYKYTPLEHTFNIINLALVKGRPRLLNIKQLLVFYLEHREEVITRRTRYLLAQAEVEAHRLEGLLMALDHIDDIISIIRASRDVETARNNLMGKYEFSHKQATHILNMALRTLTGLAREKLKQEYDEIQDKIRDFQDILSNRFRVLDIMKEDLYEVKEKYADPRKTEILEAAEDLALEDLVADEVMAVTVSHLGFIKREPLSSYRVQSRGGKGIIGSKTKTDNDFPEFLFVASTHDYLLFFTNDGRVHWQKVYDIPQLGRTAQGRAIINLLELPKGQRVVSIVPVKNFDDDASICMVSEKGYIKKCRLSEYRKPRRGGINTMSIEEGDQLLVAKLVYRKQEIVLATRNGMAVRIDESIIRDMGRTARGLKGPSLVKDDSIVSVVMGSPGDYLLTVCEKGLGKRTQIDEYRKTKTQRSRGVRNVKITEKNGPVVAVLPVQEGDDLMVMTESGKVIRSPINDIRETGRAAIGVRVVNLAENDKVTAIARVAQDDAEMANEQAAALKAEAKEEAERNGKQTSSASQSSEAPAVAPTNATNSSDASNSSDATEATDASTPQQSEVAPESKAEATTEDSEKPGQHDQVKELLNRAEDFAKETEQEGTEAEESTGEEDNKEPEAPDAEDGSEKTE